MNVFAAITAELVAGFDVVADFAVSCAPLPGGGEYEALHLLDTDNTTTSGTNFLVGLLAHETLLLQLFDCGGNPHYDSTGLPKNVKGAQLVRSEISDSV